MKPAKRRLLDGIDGYDAASVPPYEGDHATVHRYIDDHLEQHVDQLRSWLRQPSISATGEGIDEMARLVRDDLQALGFQEADLVPTSGHPGVWGFYDAGAAKTLMLYLMYDVQPADPSEWLAPPFEARIVDNELGSVVMARGAVDMKGPERALLNAIEAVVRVEGTLPVNLMVVVEGEEELGSPNLPEMINRYEDRLRTCDGVLFPFASQDAQGATSLTLGVKGLVYVDLVARGGEAGGPKGADIGGALKVLVDSPAWRLVQALASLTSADGNAVELEGFYDSVRAPSEEELRLAAGMLRGWKPMERTMKDQHAVGRWVDDAEGSESLTRYLFDPCLNLDGVGSGWTGPGVQTIVPHSASAKVDARLVPDQSPEAVVEGLRRHLDDHGFDDIEMHVLAAYPPAQVSVDEPIVQAAIGVFNRYGHVPAIAARTAGSAPWSCFTDRLGLPIVHGGLGHGAGAHAPNEYFVIDPKADSCVAGLAEVEKAYVDMLYALGDCS
jgi:acetylornithine deacetylase/succinyl-diaminopimelate desuccinylase-like protein